MGDSSKEVTEADMDAANDKRSEAAAAAAEGEHQKAVDLYTQAIELNPGAWWRGKPGIRWEGVRGGLCFVGSMHLRCGRV